ncbi:MAG: DUF2255 family protein, partial [Lewinella sp.]|nr:DUF2255 family protein [Lewinella sp.]
MSFPSSFYQHLQKHTLTGIKGGRQRPSFLDIWMVTVEGRVFARSWNKSARSWFTAFQETGEGEIKYGDRVICVRGRQPEDDPQLTAQINQAYLRKYTQPENIPYAEGITKPEYAAYTMEFFYVDDQKAGNIPEEGYIKFRADWTATPPLPWESLEELD